MPAPKQRARRRPADATRRIVRINLRLSRAEAEALAEAARRVGSTTAGYIATIALQSTAPLPRGSVDARYLLRVLIEPRVDAQRIADALRELAGVEPETDTGPAAARLYSLLAQAEHCLHRLDDTAGALAKPLRR